MAYLIIETAEDETKELCRAITDAGLIAPERRVRLISEKAPNYEAIARSIDRGTGRTTRMLREVARHPRHLTVVIAATQNECARMHCIVLELLEGKGKARRTGVGHWFIEAGNVNKIMFVPSTMDEQLLRGMFAELVFVDHYAYESNRAGCDRLYNILRR